MAASRAHAGPSASSTPALPPVDRNPHRRWATAERGSHHVRQPLGLVERQFHRFSSAVGACPVLARHSGNAGAVGTDVLECGTDSQKTRNKLDPNNLDLLVSLRYLWGCIDEWRTSNAPIVLQLSKPVLSNVVSLVRNFGTVPYRLTQLSLGSESPRYKVCLVGLRDLCRRSSGERCCRFVQLQRSCRCQSVVGSRRSNSSAQCLLYRLYKLYSINKLYITSRILLSVRYYIVPTVALIVILGIWAFALKGCFRLRATMAPRPPSAFVRFDNLLLEADLSLGLN